MPRLSSAEWALVVRALRMAADAWTMAAHSADMRNAPTQAQYHRKQAADALALQARLEA